MEEVHETYRRPWISETLSVKEFLDTAYSYLSAKFDVKEEIDYTVNERMMRLYGDQEELEQRERACSASLLDCDGDEHIELCKEFKAPENTELVTLKHQAEEMEKRNQSTVYRNMVFQACRYKFYSSSMDIVPKKRSISPSDPEFVPVKHPEVILTVQIYRPEMQQQPHQPTNPARVPTFTVDQQFLVLGSQFLTEVRDLITCQSDASVVGECSENPSSSLGFTCQEVYKSGFFYINGIFYNDMRDPLNKDYSEPVLEWSKTARGVGPFSTAKMEETRFIDLNLQLGLPYVYMHQGHCEHMLVFSAMRLVNPDDSQNMLDYPLLQILQSKKPVHCMACMIYTAKWITTEDKRLPELPYFFCDKCFSSFNYDINGKKIADFKAYKYLDKTAIF